MLKVTLDNNCLIALEDLEPAADSLKTIISYHDQGKIKLCIASITSAELTRNKTAADSYNIFIERIRTLGMQCAEILVSVPSAWAISYWGPAFQYSDKQELDLIKNIHSIMWPDTPFNHEEYRNASSGKVYKSGIAKKWRSRQMDVLTIFSHIRNSCDIFVSANVKDFGSQGSQKRKALALLGAKQIMTPSEAEQWLCQYFSCSGKLDDRQGTE